MPIRWDTVVEIQSRYSFLHLSSNVYVLKKKSMMKFTDKYNISTYAGIQYCPVIMLNEVSDASSVKHVKWPLLIERQRKSSTNILVRQNPKPPQILLTESPVVLLSAQLKRCCSPQMFVFCPPMLLQKNRTSGAFDGTFRLLKYELKGQIWIRFIWNNHGVFLVVGYFCSRPARLAVSWARKIAEVMVIDQLTKLRERNVRNMLWK